jgi:hypothetical protein
MYKKQYYEEESSEQPQLWAQDRHASRAENTIVARVSTMNITKGIAFYR